LDATEKIEMADSDDDDELGKAELGKTWLDMVISDAGFTKITPEGIKHVPRDEVMLPPVQETYLGDAVYASSDGYQIRLRTGDGNNQVIYLDGGVYKALVRFVDAMDNAGGDL
jgi:hypothetical protein